MGDVARRIAHEIKNPLTPIQLSAERLRRQYGKASPRTRSVLSVHRHDHAGRGDGLAVLRRSRSAESWIGVSGFLISCAMRRATSPQAAERCADTSSVMSSSVMT